jgi:hypothetical protein
LLGVGPAEDGVQQPLVDHAVEGLVLEEGLHVAGVAVEDWVGWGIHLRESA